MAVLDDAGLSMLPLLASGSGQANKLRLLTAAGMGKPNSLQQYFRTEPETGRVPPHIVTVEDVTKGLGLEDQDAQTVIRILQETRVDFGLPSRTVRSHQGRAILNSYLKSNKRVTDDQRLAIQRRAQAYWQKFGRTDYNATPTIRQGAQKSVRLVFYKADGAHPAGPFIGPRGGKWADAAHTIAWQAPGAEQPHGRRSAEHPPQRKPEEPAPKGSPNRFWVPSVTAFGLPADTKKHYQEDGKYTPERQKLHEKVYSKFLSGVPKVSAGKKPVAVVMMGGAAAGKGTVVKHLLGAAKDFVNVNPDDCKEQLPEYQRGIAGGETQEGVPTSARDAAASVHEESSDMANEVRKRAIANRQNLILDGTGKDAEKHAAKIEELKNAGYHVRLVMPHVDMAEAQKRAKDRAQHTGRHVPDDFVEQAHHLIPGNFEKIAQHADDAVLFDNSQSPPRPVMSVRGGKTEEHDPEFVKQFRETAKLRHENARARGWMKAWLMSLIKAEQGDPPSLDMDAFLERFKTDRGQSEDNATGIEDDEDLAAHRKPVAEQDEKTAAESTDLPHGFKVSGSAHSEVAETLRKHPHRSLGVARKDLPQLPGDQTENFLRQLKQQGVKIAKDSVPASQLKATQGEIDSDKVSKMVSERDDNATLTQKPVIVSREGYLLDGHHRWAANQHDGSDDKMRVYRVDMPIAELLQAVKTFSGAHYAKARRLADLLKAIDEMRPL